MSLDDDLNSTIESMYRAATSPDIWPVALHACNDLFGGAGVSLEVIDRTTQAHELFSSANVPSACEVEYLEHYVSICPRVDHGFRQRLGDIGYDAQVISEADMAKDEYYSSFLVPRRPRPQILHFRLPAPDTREVRCDRCATYP